jgi:hypothetical protein
MPPHNLKIMTLAEWTAEGKRRFGEGMTAWRFVCPVCGHVASENEWLRAGAPHGAIGFACVGRWIDGSKKAFEDEGPRDGPCTYTGGGLFQFNPVRVDYPDGETTTWFDFAEAS